ncbi:MAG: deoxyribodipyrimidine photo-lyase [Pseudomonadota bacterium]
MSVVPPGRIQALNDRPPAKGRYVLYWMQQSQRVPMNHALAFAVEAANERRLPLLVVFGLTADYPEANRRHYAFMLEGLQETQRALTDRKIRMIVRRGSPPAVALEAAADAAVVICDRGAMPHQKAWRRQVAERCPCRVLQVESDVVVPLAETSPKAEYAARTIRPRIHRHLERCLEAFRMPAVKVPSLTIADDGLRVDDLAAVLDALGVDGAVPPVTRFFSGGTAPAMARLDRFIENQLTTYHTDRNPPEKDVGSHLSPYLHFGQISPITMALRVQSAQAPPEAAAAFIEELVVRRELAFNFVNYTAGFDRYESLPEWARRTLAEHRSDPRPHVYDAARLEAADTHDPYWNAAMDEMRITGYMHNYMRMYWGKKVLEWSETPEAAFDTLLRLNNRYFLDGRDPNAYAGVGWIFGIHDRAWPARAIYGKVRSMMASGLERKFDIGKYVDRIAALKA